LVIRRPFGHDGGVVLTRIAPTPSGFLHAGNRRNFALTVEQARRWGADIALRIDDADADRYRREYVEDIFRTLHDMGILWQVGPANIADFEARWSQRTRIDYYRAELDQARERGLTAYACTCARAVQQGPASGGCAGGCRSRSLELVPGETALRVIVPEGTIVTVGGAGIDIAAEMGDFIVWRRDDVPAYQLVSVIEDRDLGTTHIVRGEDLLASSAAQVFLASSLGAPNVANATYVHHALITDEAGLKLSKSQVPREDR
jgi:glutamyl-tRNA synthetase